MGVRLSLEIVNRYETNVMNTARAGLGFLDRVANGHVSLHLDTYQMNIEESDQFLPVLDAAGHVGYVPIGESHRGYLGTGTVNRVVLLGRDLWQDSDDLATHANRFIRDKLRAVETISLH